MRRAVGLVLIGLTLAGVAGYLGPWVPHKAAGLVILGLDLGEYVKFLPQVRSGEIAIRREVFYLPLFAASAGFALLASRRTLPGWLRVLLGLAAFPLAFAMLPPAWKPATFFDPEYRLQAFAIAVCAVLVPGVILTRYLPARIVLALLALLDVAAAAGPAFSFIAVRPAILALYRQPLPFGWGFWVCAVVFLLAALLCVAEILRRSPDSATGTRWVPVVQRR